MKRFLIFCTACFMACMAMAQIQPEVKTVLNYDKNLIMGYTITYEYPIEDIETAVIERLEKEGVEGSKKKNFYAFKGIKYNYIWNKTFDMYVQFTGSKNAGTINMILSQGYDNFIIPTEDSITTAKVYDWLISLDLDIQNYRYNVAMEAHQEEYKGIDKELSKLEKQRTKIEKKIKKNADAQLKFEATRTIVGENDLNVDAKKIEKEQIKAQKLLDEKHELEDELKQINDKIDNVRSDLNKKNSVISDLEKEKPKTNTLQKSKK